MDIELEKPKKTISPKSIYQKLDESPTVSKQDTGESNYNQKLPRRFVEKLTDYTLNTLMACERDGLITPHKTQEKSFEVVSYSIEDVQKVFHKKGFKFKSKKEAEVITVWSQKGGTGKSSSTQQLAATLSLMGKVLVVDLDSQADITSLLGSEVIFDDVVSEDTVLNPTIMEAIDWSLKDGMEFNDPIAKLEPEQVIQKLTPTLHLIPSDLDLAEINYTINNSPLSDRKDSSGNTVSGKLYLIKEVVDKLKFQYDYIIFDTPPSIEVIILNALMASNRILIPVELEAKSLRTMRRNANFLKRLKVANSGFNFEKILMVPTKFKKEKIKIKALGLLEQIYKNSEIQISQVMIPNSAIVDKAADLKEPFYAISFKHGSDYKPYKKAAQEFTDYYWVLAHELLDLELNHLIYASSEEAEGI
jgi:chromosome partitioning protein